MLFSELSFSFCGALRLSIMPSVGIYVTYVSIYQCYVLLFMHLSVCPCVCACVKTDSTYVVYSKHFSWILHTYVYCLLVCLDVFEYISRILCKFRSPRDLCYNYVYMYYMIVIYVNSIICMASY